MAAHLSWDEVRGCQVPTAADQRCGNNLARGAAKRAALLSAGGEQCISAASQPRYPSVRNSSIGGGGHGASAGGPVAMTFHRHAANTRLNFCAKEIERPSEFRRS